MIPAREEPITLTQLQHEHRAWSDKNFGPNQDWRDPFLGVVEEIGELSEALGDNWDSAELMATLGKLSHALLKQRQNIRGGFDKHEADAKDAVADVIVFLVALCNTRGWDLAQILADTWAVVSKREWRAPSS